MWKETRKIKSIFIIQILGAICISFLFQFIFPLWWQPLDAFNRGKVNHFDPNTNITIFTISLWQFAFSVMWFLNPDNVFINNFLVYSVPSHTMIMIQEFFIFGLYIDYIHLLPLILGYLILLKKRETLKQRLLPYYLVGISTILFMDYFLELAYYGGPLWAFIVRWVILTLLNISLSFTFDK
jgi:hypothetical protein